MGVALRGLTLREPDPVGLPQRDREAVDSVAVGDTVGELGVRDGDGVAEELRPEQEGDVAVGDRDPAVHVGDVRVTVLESEAVKDVECERPAEGEAEGEGDAEAEWLSVKETVGVGGEAVCVE